MITADSDLDFPYEALFLAAPSPFLLLKPDSPHFTIALLNDAYAQVTGRRREELIGRGLFEAFPPNPAEGESNGQTRLTASLDYVMTHGRPHEMPEHKYDLPGEGSFVERFWKPLNQPIFDAAGKICYILHRVEDVTEKIRVERDRNQFFALATDILIKLDFEGCFTDVNAASKAVLGWTPEEMVGQRWVDLVHPQDRQAAQGYLSRALSDELCEEFEISYLCQDGNFRWLSWKIRSAVQEQTIYAVAADVTQSRRLRSITEGQKRGLEMSVNNEPLPRILDLLLRTMEENASRGVHASIMLLSPDGKSLLSGAGPSLPPEYLEACNGMAVGPDRGSCGSAASSGRAHSASDIATDPAWADGRDLALGHGLRACWSTPIFSTAGTVLGTFVLYFT
ncbi:MAG: PAS domain-containing protein, partial [Lewinella sp.]